ncbi:Ldh family oxidoreductase [Granulosicoccus antarcticus]|uniref:Putative oxidoreductase YjmC n=1 Tax=Granulosicoccus antarcticus IMCC3135 TaxID=1192854 RepID=A0A2Z2P3X4_9GAMM|nr:Ldh family oxidoreductase [Granulosicoccus antarcticus]ASJ76110.1 putative oxidoreductase YjmC [Granulosicoccus antarcticus IMCC3135]
MSDPDKPVSVASLQAFIHRALTSQGVPEADASKVSSLMVEADIFGHDTHGVFRLRQYLARLRDGGCNAQPNIVVAHETVATALIDGDNGLGHLAMNQACELAIEKARSAGIGWVGVRRGNHAGPLALYVRPQANAGMIGMAAAVGSANHVPPFGGTDLLLGTNPVAISAPNGSDDPFVLDMASTVAAMGKIKTLAQRGEAMPEGWMVGRDGEPLTDPNRKSEGFLLPIGGPKGFGLSVAIGLLAGVANGAAFGSNVVDFTADTSSETNTGQFVMALDPAAFGMGEDFAQTAAQAFDEMRASPPLPGHAPVRLPGDGKHEVAEQRRRNGLLLGPALHQDLLALAELHGFDATLEPGI